MTTYRWDTNAGPIVTITAPTAAAARRRVEERVPMLRRRGYAASWRRSGKWHVLDVLNSRGRAVHSCAFIAERVAS